MNELELPAYDAMVLTLTKEMSDFSKRQLMRVQIRNLLQTG